MKNLNPNTNEILKEDKQESIRDSSKLLAEFFNGVVIQLGEKYKKE